MSPRHNPGSSLSQEKAGGTDLLDDSFITSIGYVNSFMNGLFFVNANTDRRYLVNPATETNYWQHTFTDTAIKCLTILQTTLFWALTVDNHPNKCSSTRQYCHSKLDSLPSTWKAIMSWKHFAKQFLPRDFRRTSKGVTRLQHCLLQLNWLYLLWLYSCIV